jgi:hypothetical protein
LYEALDQIVKEYSAKENETNKTELQADIKEYLYYYQET